MVEKKERKMKKRRNEKKILKQILLSVKVTGREREELLEL